MIFHKHRLSITSAGPNLRDRGGRLPSDARPHAPIPGFAARAGGAAAARRLLKRGSRALPGTLTALQVLMGLHIPAARAAPEPPRKPPVAIRKGRDMLVIDDQWRARTDPGNAAETAGWTRAIPPDTRPAIVPSLWPAGTGRSAPAVQWYFRELDPPGGWQGQTVRLRFEAAAEYAQVWVNGERVGEHRGGATPFDFNITKSLKLGARNLLVVRLEGDAARGAGIWQGVLLMAHDEAFISDVFPYAGPLGNLVAEVELTNTSDKSGDASLDAKIVGASPPGPELKRTGQNLGLTPRRNVTTLLANVPRKRVNPWSPAAPSTYFLDLAFRQDKDVLDTTETVFGFRELGWRDGQITINGAPIALRSVAPQPPRPVVLATVDDRTAAAAMLKRLKAAGASVVYLEAPPPALLTLADETGLLVVERARLGLDTAAAAAELAELVRRDRSHPSIIAWDTGAMGDEVANRIRKSDPTRFVLRHTGDRAFLTPPHVDDLQEMAAPAGLLPPKP